MGEYLRWAAVVLIGVILSLVLGRQSRDMSMVLSLAVCVLVSIAAIDFLEPTMELIRQLRRLGNLSTDAVSILLKAAGVGVISELAGLICSDAGEHAMGRSLQILSNAAILWLSLPLLRQILTIIEGVLAQT